MERWDSSAFTFQQTTIEQAPAVGNDVTEGIQRNDGLQTRIVPRFETTSRFSDHPI